MAETFPLQAFERIGLAVRSGQAFRRDGRGLLLTRRQTEPYWAGPFVTDKLAPDERANLIAFLTDCVDRNLRVDFIHPRFRLPRAYSLATWPLLVDPIVASIPHRRQINVTGLAPGMTLKRGDRLTLMQGELRCHRMLAADLVVAGAGPHALSVTPRLPLGVFTAGATVRLKDPAIRLAIVPESFDNDEVYEATSIAFDTLEALQ